MPAEKRDTTGDLASLIAKLTKRLPNVHADPKRNHTSFLVGDKVFAYTSGENALVIKLPAKTIETLIAAKRATPLVMGKRTMKEWAVLTHDDASAFEDDAQLVRESVTFVSREG